MTGVGDRPRAWRIGLAQIAPALGDVGRNVALHLRFVEQARSAGVDLLIFPELSLTGYNLQDLTAEVAMPASAPLLRKLSQAAGPMDVVVGFVEEDRDFRFYNSAAYLSGGSVVYCHRKAYLPTYGMFDEARYFAAGQRVAAFETRLGPMGLMICEDAWHASVPWLLAQDGAQTLIILSSGPGRGVLGPSLGSAETWYLLNRAYAHLFGVYVAYCNRYGFEDGVNFWGGSEVVDPFAAVVAQADQFSEDLVVAEVDPQVVRRSRTITPLHRDERLEITWNELMRIRRRVWGEQA